MRPRHSGCGRNRTIPVGPDLKENEANLYGRDPEKGGVKPVGCPVAQVGGRLRADRHPAGRRLSEVARPTNVYTE